MLIAIAFLCSIHATDCEREATVRAIVGQGATPVGCLIDGWQGVAANRALDHGPAETIIMACRRKR